MAAGAIRGSSQGNLWFRHSGLCRSMANREWIFSTAMHRFAPPGTVC
jgi:hypothetical protein